MAAGSFKYRFAAQVLMDANQIGVSEAAKKHKLTEDRIKLWFARLKKDSKFARIYRNLLVIDQEKQAQVVAAAITEGVKHLTSLIASTDKDDIKDLSVAIKNLGNLHEFLTAYRDASRSQPDDDLPDEPYEEPPEEGPEEG